MEAFDLSRVFLLRHAKAGWALPGMRDYDRPLDETGKRDARAIGAAMRDAGYAPDLVFCSAALRARETLEGLARSLDVDNVAYCDMLYSTDAGGYLETIRRGGHAGSLLLVGHNPMMEDLAIALTGNGVNDARRRLESGFPTAGLAVIRFEGPLCDVAPGHGRLDAFLHPGNI